MNKLLLISSFLILLASCGREPIDEMTFGEPVINPSTSPVEGGLVGIITTTGNLPVEDAMVGFNGQQTMTDENGNFSFPESMLYRDGTYVTVEKPGYLFGSRKIYALEGEINVAEVELIPMEQGSQINQTEISLLDLENLQVQFPAGNYMLGANEIFNGDVYAQLSTIDASNQNNYIKLPGDLTGASSTFEIKALTNLGVFHINLTSQINEQLQLPTDSKAQFELKLTEADIIPLPSVVSVFYFDQINGTWLEKGEASLVNDYYMGEVDAAGYWMVGESFPFADIEGSLLINDLSDMNFDDTELEIFNLDRGYLNEVRTTRSGRYATRVPQDVNLDLVVFYDCAVGNQIEELGILTTQELVIDEIEIEADMENIFIQGTITNCDGDVEDQSFIKISFEDEQFLYRADSNGNFDYSFSNCSEETVTIIAINEKDSKISEPYEIAITNEIEAGDIQTCNDVAAGYAIDYLNMDWQNALTNSVNHSWTISRISGANGRTIFSTQMIDVNTNVSYLRGVFVINDNETLVDYQLTFDTQSFHLFGECQVEEVVQDGITSFRFFGVGDEIEEIDPNIFPGGIDSVSFDLVYYD